MIRSLLPLFLLAATPALADEGVLLEGDSAQVKAGGYLWRPELAPPGPVSIVISIPRQLAFVYRDDMLIGIASVSTGKRGHSTPTGPFTVLQKRVHHRSNLYSNAPMPYMQRLTWGGVALHAGHNPGFPASHGCIRLPHAFAALLFKETALGAEVVITGEPIGVAGQGAYELTGAPDAEETTVLLVADDLPVEPLALGLTDGAQRSR